MVDLSMNWLAIIVAALVPMILGALYYGPVFGKAWRASLGKTEEELTPNNMPLSYGGALICAFLVSTSLNFIIQLVHKDINSAGELFINTSSTFGHGAFHGAMLGLTFVGPVIISLSIFHKINWKAVVLNVIFWTICFTVMGGILDMWK